MEEFQEKKPREAQIVDLQQSMTNALNTLRAIHTIRSVLHNLPSGREEIKEILKNNEEDVIVQVSNDSNMIVN